VVINEPAFKSKEEYDVKLNRCLLSAPEVYHGTAAFSEGRRRTVMTEREGGGDATLGQMSKNEKEG
jgi:hypothetical protein